MSGRGYGSGPHNRFSATDLSELSIAISLARNRSEFRQQVERALCSGITDIELFDILNEVTRQHRWEN